MGLRLAQFLDGGIADDFGDAGIGIYFDFANMRAVREGDGGRLEFSTFGQAAFLAGRNEIGINEARPTAATSIERSVPAM